ncbi:hypothetical protein BC941DRAFT_434373 [Chlamydoabsidia padenii]|nr:hypothetical protein BC941DRAFT_434373 [Chlamydoabsidia padenii]
MWQNNQSTPTNVSTTTSMASSNTVSSPASADLSAAPQWKETKTPEGRIYWYNTNTRQSTWKKPVELWTEEEKAIDACPWKEYTSPDGKKYYSHKETKQTTWKIPEEYKDLMTTLERIKETERATPPDRSTQPPVNISPVAATAVPSPAPMPYTPSPPVYNHPIRPPSSASLLLSQPPDIVVDSPEKAMEQFHLLLKSKGVTSDWNWEETMRAIITDPRYRVFKTTGERKAAFQSYVNLEAKRKREEKETQEKKERDEFYAMLESIPQVKPYSTYRTVLPLLVSHPAFQQVTPERQRQNLFHDYIHHVRRTEKDRARKLKKEHMGQFKSQVLDGIDIKGYTDIPFWKDIYQQHVLGGDNKYEGMTPLDFLEVFQDYHQEVWEQPLAKYHQRMEQQQHLDRLARDGFKQLLNSLCQEGAINAYTQWKDIYPRVADDARYINLLGVPSSTPLDLFWDLVDDLDQDLYNQRKKVQEYLKQHGEKVTLETTLEDYQAILEAHPALLNQINAINIPLIYKEIQDKEIRRQQELAKKQQRKTEKRIKALRHTIRKLDNPSLTVNDTWETIEPRLKDHATYLELEHDEDAKLEAFRQALEKLEAKNLGHTLDDDEDDEDEDDDEEGMIKDR